MWVTAEELSDALNHASITVRDPRGLVLTGASGLPPEAQVTEAKGKAKYPDEVAEGLLSRVEGNRGAALREPEPYQVTLADIAGSHVDTELALMAAILHGMEQLAPDARQRIRNWVDERFVPRRVNG